MCQFANVPMILTRKELLIGARSISKCENAVICQCANDPHQKGTTDWSTLNWHIGKFAHWQISQRYTAIRCVLTKSGVIFPAFATSSFIFPDGNAGMWQSMQLSLNTKPPGGFTVQVS